MIATIWTVPIQVIKQRNYDLKAINPNAKDQADVRTPAGLLDLIEARGHEVAEALAALRALGHARER